MINKNHKYKVTGFHGVVYVTYDDYGSALEFKKNAAKVCGHLQIEPLKI